MVNSSANTITQTNSRLTGKKIQKSLIKKSLISRVYRDRVLILMILPSVLYYLILDYLPLAGIVIAFKHFKYNLGAFRSPWAGLDNFRFFFISGQAFNVTRNTFLYNLAFIVIGTSITVTMAIFLSELTGKYLKKLMQSAMFLPYFVSWVTGAALFFGLFNFEYGVVNGILNVLGKEPIDVFNNSAAWPYIIICAHLWKSTGYGAIFYLAAIVGIDGEIYDAAEIDGANLFQRIRLITLPCLVPTIVILTLLAIGHIFRGDFGLFYQLTGNNPLLYDKTDVIDTFVFRALLQVREEGMAAAAGFYQSVLCFITIVCMNSAVKKYNKDYSLF